MPTQAVVPGMPSTPSAVVTGPTPGSSGRSPATGTAEKRCHPKPPSTQSPGWKRPVGSSFTWETHCPSITAPISTGAE